MKTLREKLTLFFSAIAYFLFHLRLGPDAGTIVVGTFAQLLQTLPYTIGFTYLLVLFIRYASGGTWPPWDRTARIFFTFGIILAFFFALYEYAEKGQSKEGAPASIGLRILDGDSRKELWYSA